MIAIIDSGVANLGSVKAAFQRIGVPVRVVSDGGSVERAEALVLPGVGAFADAMAELRERNLVEPIRAAAARGTPLMGICLGMQLLAEESNEFGRHAGLGLIPGRVVRLEPSHPCERVPNIGWCDLAPTSDARLYRNVKSGTAFYFVHSYVFQCTDPADVAATIRFGDRPVVAVVQRGNIHGAQFHPEKSQDAGLAVLAAFSTLVDGGTRHA
jgi:glutamine amidotransferase